MNYTALGSTNLTVSRICLGCMGFGDAQNGQHSWTLDEESSREIIRRVAELSARRGVSMTEISLAWLLTKVTAPVVGATRLRHIEGAAKAVELTLSPEEAAFLEEPYLPHRLVGVMAQNTPAAAGQPQVWSAGGRKS